MDGSPEYPNAAAVSFRSLRSLTAKARNAALAAGAIAFQIDDWLTEEYLLPDHDVMVDQELAPVEAALRLRASWGIGNRPIGNMINLLEAHGVRVFSLVEETRHLDAYSLWRNDRPYVFLNTLKTAERSRFDAAHELAHLVMHRHRGSQHASAETEADQFASAFLMPPADVKAELPRVRGLREVIIKKRRWGVSAAALVYTLRHREETISEWHYRQYCIQLGKMGRVQEPNPMPRETSQIWQKVLQDLWKRGVSLSRLARQLNVPEAEFRSLLFGIATEPIGPSGTPSGGDRTKLRVVN
jgi:Zn-dependent peptidase ImmA (M78 family)